MLAGAGWAWTEIGKTLNSLGFGSGGFDFDFSNYNFPAVDNKVEQAKNIGIKVISLNELKKLLN